MMVADLREDEYHAYYGRYISRLAGSTELRSGFMSGASAVRQFFSSIPEDKLVYRYAADKWSVKEILQHLIDTERIFMYRCFRISRADRTPLAGFNQDIYVEPSGAHGKMLPALLEELAAVRGSSVSLLNSLSDADLQQIGDANGSAMSARAAAFTVIGHEVWHMEIIRERYL